MATLELDSVAISYGDLEVVHEVSFSVDEGEFVTLLGPSGSGKTSLLRAIAGFQTPSKGTVVLDGQTLNNVPPYERDIGMVFQSYALFPHMTVRKNLEFGLRMTKVPAAEIATRVCESIEYVRLTGYEDRYPSELSGGQQQRVAIARALALHPRLLLLDEPMSNLDARLRANMRFELVEVLERTGVTALSVTHNQEEALAMSDRIIVMQDGSVEQVGSPKEIYSQPVNPFVADFIGDANIIEARVDAVDAKGTRVVSSWNTTLHMRGETEPGAESVTLLVRPESIELRSAGDGKEVPVETHNVVEATLVQAAYMGSVLEYRVAVADRTFVVRRTTDADVLMLEPGDACLLIWSPSAMVAVGR